MAANGFLRRLYKLCIKISSIIFMIIFWDLWLSYGIWRLTWLRVDVWEAQALVFSVLAILGVMLAIFVLVGKRVTSFDEIADIVFIWTLLTLPNLGRQGMKAIVVANVLYHITMGPVSSVPYLMQQTMQYGLCMVVGAKNPSISLFQLAKSVQSGICKYASLGSNLKCELNLVPLPGIEILLASIEELMYGLRKIMNVCLGVIMCIKTVNVLCSICLPPLASYFDICKYQCDRTTPQIVTKTLWENAKTGIVLIVTSAITIGFEKVFYSFIRKAVDVVEEKYIKKRSQNFGLFSLNVTGGSAPARDLASGIFNTFNFEYSSVLDKPSCKVDFDSETSFIDVCIISGMLCILICMSIFENQCILFKSNCMRRFHDFMIKL